MSSRALSRNTFGQRLRTWLVKPPGMGKNDCFRLNEILHGPTVSYTLDALLILDVLILIVTINLETHFLMSEVEDFEDACTSGQCSMFESAEERHEAFEDFGNHTLEEVDHVLIWVSVTILSLFILEHLLLIVANGWDYFLHPLQVFDLIVVSLSIMVEVAFAGEQSVGLIVIARFWRFVRIGHGVFDVEHHLEERHHQRAQNGQRALPPRVPSADDPAYGEDGKVEVVDLESRG